MTISIGFMQGRLSPQIDGRIQSFPWGAWKDEFALAKKLGLNLMEWTLDQDRLYQNPLLTKVGRKEIRSLCGLNKIKVHSLTGDCFMQAPFWKEWGIARATHENDFLEIAKASAAVGIKMIVIPLVDNGRIETDDQEDILISFLQSQSQLLNMLGLKVVFESDYEPIRLAKFIELLTPELFGINYDIGNSAALGFSPKEEFAAYGNRILNVHIKDRLLGGTTVPLGHGNADFEAVFSSLSKVGYRGAFILQTARALDGDHAGVLMRYHNMTKKWIDKYAT